MKKMKYAFLFPVLCLLLLSGCFKPKYTVYSLNQKNIDELKIEGKEDSLEFRTEGVIDMDRLRLIDPEKSRADNKGILVLTAPEQIYSKKKEIPLIKPEGVTNKISSGTLVLDPGGGCPLTFSQQEDDKVFKIKIAKNTNINADETETCGAVYKVNKNPKLIILVKPDGPLKLKGKKMKTQNRGRRKRK